MATSPTQRTLKWLREDGWLADVVERWVPWPGADGVRKGNRHDAFGILDILALKPGEPILGVQCFGATGMPSHRAKVQEAPATALWLGAGGRLLLVGWRKVRVKRGGKAMRWEPRIEEVKDDS